MSADQAEREGVYYRCIRGASAHIALGQADSFTVEDDLGRSWACHPIKTKVLDYIEMMAEPPGIERELRNQETVVRIVYCADPGDVRTALARCQTFADWTRCRTGPRWPNNMPDRCPFCEPDSERIWMENAIGLVLWDAFPVTKGHTLVVPRKHVASIYELSPVEQAALWGLVGEARQQLQDQLHPDGFNVGVNDGVAAGQTVPHVHVHVIPRRTGDVADPRGGVRWVIPDKARYW